MARKPMVTRTILTTQATALCMDINSCEASNVTVTLPRTFKNAEKMLKAVKEEVENETLRVVDIVDHKTVETLYGMTEQSFINGAVKLDPTTRKELEEEDTEDEE